MISDLLPSFATFWLYLMLMFMLVVRLCFISFDCCLCCVPRVRLSIINNNNNNAIVTLAVVGRPIRWS